MAFFKRNKERSASGTVWVQAPITGQAVGLDRVPDPAFAEKMMGEGIAIVPSAGKVLAPFDGRVANLMKSKHALIIEHASGVQVLIHVGVDTVSLKGEGFTAHVQEGDLVAIGQLLLEFDSALIHGRGLPDITSIIIPHGLDAVGEVTEYPGEVTAGQENVLSVKLQ
ncbi:PTS sugar transporter subunit IIA [Paenibacillus donghaensis]|uniref:PTS glucose transporter subunit IIA n=1 Tax=Paenibacillus donghaensis TaxID=414771 RepID=A0A2Z2K3D2_9BACL|nr:PTS glucose transporter subunit IIA [Paenibacillus donghaensis]ASA19796.1 PTS glucose transporter subunit IIA [Paenibacillus donghaensis]